MKYLLLFVALVVSVPAVAAPYNFIHAESSYSTLGGVTTLTVHLHNNADKQASCEVGFVNQNRSALVPAYGTATVQFQVYTSGSVTYSCTAN